MLCYMHENLHVPFLPVSYMFWSDEGKIIVVICTNYLTLCMDSSLLSGSGFGEVTFTQMLNSISFFKIHCDIKVKLDTKTQASEMFVVLTLFIKQILLFTCLCRKCSQNWLNWVFLFWKQIHLTWPIPICWVFAN